MCLIRKLNEFMKGNLIITTSAVFNKDFTKRYALRCNIDHIGKTNNCSDCKTNRCFNCTRNKCIVCFGKNPSYAGGEKKIDNTTTRLINMAVRNGYTSIIILNLSPIIQTKNFKNTKSNDENMAVIKNVIESFTDVFCFWGADGSNFEDIDFITSMLKQKNTYSRGQTKQNQPLHVIGATSDFKINEHILF
jgi:hypothetical protein